MITSLVSGEIEVLVSTIEVLNTSKTTPFQIEDHVETAEDVRRARVTAREGDPSSWWELWAAQEKVLLEERDSRALATYVVEQLDTLPT